MEEKKKKVDKKKPSPKKVNKEPRFEERLDIKKLLLYTIIVPRGQSDNIARLLKTNKSSAQFFQIGEGTASSRIREILDIDDTDKDIIYTIVSEEAAKEIKKELDVFFLVNKKNRGIAYTIPLTTLMGVKMYKFFTQTVRG